ncbi:MAG: S-layer homology domain-containing protein, partial [Clostridia bacterium]|nr:S-layer homology domain-containing protein [Clostridia bacterium]
ALADILSRMSFEADIEVDILDLLLKAADSALYGYFKFTVDFVAELNALRAAAPEAQVVVTGLTADFSASLVGALVDMSAFEEYTDLIVGVLNQHLFAYAAINTNTTYVENAADIADAIIVTRADHVWGDWYEATPATEDDNGLERRDCQHCDAYETRLIPALGHTHAYGAWQYDETNHWHECVCGDKIDVAAHYYGDDNICDICGHNKAPAGPVFPAGGYVGYSWNCNGGKNCPSRQFKDLAAALDKNPDIWWHEYTDYVISNKLMNGMEEDLFMPNYTTTRAMLVTILWRQAGSPIVKTDMPFEDVEEGTWYADAIRWAAVNGIVDGMTDTEFAPNAKITREQMVTIFYRYANSKLPNRYMGNPKTIEKFSDVDEISSWAYDAMQWACGIKFVDGKENNNLDPAGNATRAEMAALITRFIVKVL